MSSVEEIENRMNIKEAIDILEPKDNNDLSNHFDNTRFFEAIHILLTAYEKEKEKNKEHKEKILYWLDRLDLEEALQDEYDELDGCQAVVKILKQLLKEE